MFTKYNPNPVLSFENRVKKATTALNILSRQIERNINEKWDTGLIELNFNSYFCGEAELTSIWMYVITLKQTNYSNEFDYTTDLYDIFNITEFEKKCKDIIYQIFGKKYIDYELSNERNFSGYNKGMMFSGDDVLFGIVLTQTDE